jgi:hypothetical protein
MVDSFQIICEDYVISIKWILNQLLNNYFLYYLLNLKKCKFPPSISSVTFTLTHFFSFFSCSYTSFYYRKRLSFFSSFPSCDTLETKNQWARDDPAFIVVQILFVEVLEHLPSSLKSYLGGSISLCNGISECQHMGLSLGSSLCASGRLVPCWSCCRINLLLFSQ